MNKAKIDPNTTSPNVEYLLNYNTFIVVGRTEKNILGKENASTIVDLLKLIVMRCKYSTTFGILGSTWRGLVS